MTQLPDRTRDLLSVLDLDASPQELKQRLARHSWDAEAALVTLTRAHMKNVLGRFLEERLSASDVEDWANLLESREDVGYEPGYADALKDLLFELANPSMTTALTPGRVAELLRQVDGESPSGG